jgi:hypothetical protein
MLGVDINQVLLYAQLLVMCNENERADSFLEIGVVVIKNELNAV